MLVSFAYQFSYFIIFAFSEISSRIHNVRNSMYNKRI